VAAYWVKSVTLQMLWDWANDKQTTDEINNELLVCTDHKEMTVLHIAADWHFIMFKKLWDWTNEILTTEQI
jgi:hypothetical protein